MGKKVRGGIFFSFFIKFATKMNCKGKCKYGEAYF